MEKLEEISILCTCLLAALPLEEAAFAVRFNILSNLINKLDTLSFTLGQRKREREGMFGASMVTQVRSIANSLLASCPFFQPQSRLDL